MAVILSGGSEDKSKSKIIQVVAEFSSWRL